MAKGYWVENDEADNMEVYKKYLKASAKLFAQSGASFLVLGGEGLVKKGALELRTIVLEFNLYENSVACCDSDAYQKA